MAKKEAADSKTKAKAKPAKAEKAKKGGIKKYFKDLKSEIATFRDNEYAITNYYTSASTDVVYDTVDGYDFAKLYGTFSIRSGGKAQLLQEIFLLRKDSNGHWKIYGWQPVEASDE